MSCFSLDDFGTMLISDRSCNHWECMLLDFWKIMFSTSHQRLKLIRFWCSFCFWCPIYWCAAWLVIGVLAINYISSGKKIICSGLVYDLKLMIKNTVLHVDIFTNIYSTINILSILIFEFKICPYMTFSW